MALEFSTYLSKTLPQIPLKSAMAVIELHKEGGTVPFIARYRKERTGSLDEVQIKDILDCNEQFGELVKRQAYIIKEVESQGNLTNELKNLILATLDLADLEELYRPYKKKKKTKATEAREAGIGPLADWIWELGQGTNKDTTTLEVKAKEFINPAAKFITYEVVLKGASHIISEKISSQVDLRAKVLTDILDHGKVVSRAAKGFKSNSKYEMYKEFDEPVKKIVEPKASHRYLAMRRGWQESELTLTIEPGNLPVLEKAFVDFAMPHKGSQGSDFLIETAKKSLEESVIPSVVNEVHRRLKDEADSHAIQVFSENVRGLLLASPFGPKCVLGVDPGLRTGCKVALVDKGGNFLTDTVIHLRGEEDEKKVTELFKELFSKIQIEAIAVGNGTGGRETEGALRKILKSLDSKVPVVLINESGASVYSASEVAREEFPNLDITVRGAISIARRLQDPLAELVKIDPKSIGVGQYQHDVSPTRLKKSLDFVVESCVNNVGVDVNTASAYLLSYVSGIGPALGKNIVDYRKENGLFTDRESLQKVPRLSSKVFEQAAGFLRVPGGKNILDQTGIHPERYAAVREMAQELEMTLSQVMGEGAKKLLELRTKWASLVGEFTFDDIVKELEKPARDPRDPFKVFSFREDIFEVKDLTDGMICPGIVTNVTNFGAFVDIGVHQDGLVHISELSDKFVDDPRKVVNPGDQVQVKVLKVDKEKNQISLTMKMASSPERRAAEPRAPRPERPRGEGRSAGPRGEPGPRKDFGPRKEGGARDSRPGDGPRQGDGGRDFKPRGDFKPRDNQDQPRRDSRPPMGSTGKGTGPHKGGGGQRPPQKPVSPFNNSFGALADLKIKR